MILIEKRPNLVYSVSDGIIDLGYIWRPTYADIYVYYSFGRAYGSEAMKLIAAELDNLNNVINN